MSVKSTEQSIIEEVTALKTKFETIRSDTEDFISSAKHLADTGVQEASELMDSAKKNWQGLLASFGNTGISALFAKSKKATKGKAVAKVKKVAKKAVKTAKKKVK